MCLEIAGGEVVEEAGGLMVWDVEKGRCVGREKSCMGERW